MNNGSISHNALSTGLVLCFLHCDECLTLITLVLPHWTCPLSANSTNTDNHSSAQLEAFSLRKICTGNKKTTYCCKFKKSDVYKKKIKKEKVFE